MQTVLIRLSSTSYIEYCIQINMYHVNAQGVDERMIKVHYFCCYLLSWLPYRISVPVLRGKTRAVLLRAFLFHVVQPRAVQPWLSCQ